MALYDLLDEGKIGNLKGLVPTMQNWSTCAVGEKLNLKPSQAQKTKNNLDKILREHDHKLWQMGNLVYHQLKDYLYYVDPHTHKTMMDTMKDIKQYTPSKKLLAAIKRYQRK